MMTRARELSIGIAMLALCGTAASAAINYILGDREHLTKISGVGTGGQWTGESGNYQAIYAVDEWESYDDACGLAARTRHMNLLGSQRHEVIAGDCKVSGVKTAELTNTDTFARGIQVCLSATDRVKGIRLYGARLDRATGKLTNTTGYQEFTRPNCKTWKTATYCPVGMVATRLGGPIVHHNFTGISLYCREVTRK
jgi:hypothetical protein